MAVEEPGPSANDQSHSLQESENPVTPGLTKITKDGTNAKRTKIERARERREVASCQRAHLEDPMESPWRYWKGRRRKGDPPGSSAGPIV